MKGMNANDNHGRKIKAIYWPDTLDAEGGRVLAENGVGLVFASSHHGDRDEHWVIQIQEGRETARHNPRFLEGIVWADED